MTGTRLSPYHYKKFPRYLLERNIRNWKNIIKTPSGCFSGVYILALLLGCKPLGNWFWYLYAPPRCTARGQPFMNTNSHNRAHLALATSITFLQKDVQGSLYLFLNLHYLGSKSFPHVCSFEREVGRQLLRITFLASPLPQRIFTSQLLPP